MKFYSFLLLRFLKDHKSTDKKLSVAYLKLEMMSPNFCDSGDVHMRIEIRLQGYQNKETKNQEKAQQKKRCVSRDVVTHS